VTSLRIRDVPPPCCVRLSWCFLIASRRMSAIEHMVPLRSIHNPAMVVEQRKVARGTPSRFRCYGTFRILPLLLGINPLVVHRVAQLAGAARGARRIRVPFPSRFLWPPYFIRCRKRGLNQRRLRDFVCILGSAFRR
jgi:hypothetical protein